MFLFQLVSREGLDPHQSGTIPFWIPVNHPVVSASESITCARCGESYEIVPDQDSSPSCPHCFTEHENDVSPSPASLSSLSPRAILWIRVGGLFVLLFGVFPVLGMLGIFLLVMLLYSSGGLAIALPWLVIGAGGFMMIWGGARTLSFPRYGPLMIQFWGVLVLIVGLLLNQVASALSSPVPRNSSASDLMGLILYTGLAALPYLMSRVVKRVDL